MEQRPRHAKMQVHRSRLGRDKIRALSEGYLTEAFRKFVGQRRRGIRTALLPGLALVTTVTVGVSCLVGPNYTTPKSDVAPAWLPTPAAAPQPLNAADAYWWKVFQDPVLDGLVESAYENNLTLQLAGVRVLGARAQLNKSIGNLFPQQQGVSGAITWNQVNTPTTVNRADDNLLFAATWEIDVWGKIRRGIESDRAAYLGTIATYDDVLVTVLADVASSYVNIRTAEERLKVAAKNVETQKESLRVASVQFKYGETSELDVQQASTLLAQTQAQIPTLQNDVRQAKDALAVLLGVTPVEIDQRLRGTAGGIPVAPAEAAVGIPKDLLRRRPDVRAAGLTAASQSALIGVAVAQMYPAFSLAGAFGVASTNLGPSSLSDMFLWQNRVAQAGASFFFPFFNYGRLVNQVRVQDAQFQEAVLNYQNTVLKAQQEVEDGLSAFATSREALSSLETASAAATRTTELSLLQYKAGETNYTTVITSEQSQLTIEDSLASTKGNVALGLIAVYRALGGGWELRGDRDVVSDEVKSEMDRRTNWGRMLETAQHMPKESPVEEP
jgi:NodT family efflux transporter outer membrane factor (OMF) lipoprotein